MIYKLARPNQLTGQERNYIIRIENNEPTAIPKDPANRHYQEYLAWLAEGNTPEPPDYVPAIDQLRNQRDQLLSETDTPWGLADYTHPNKQAWLDYRQALRDITIDADPQLDENGDLTNITWPQKPEL